MLYEYQNCAETFASQLTDLTSMKTLIEDLWDFYYTERITTIKCLKLMVDCPLSVFVSGFGLGKLRALIGGSLTCKP